MVPKKAISLLFLPAIALTLSACTPPNPNADLSFQGKPPDTSEVADPGKIAAPPLTGKTPTSTAQPNKIKELTNQLPFQKKDSMKTLEDFQPITAKEVTLNTTKGVITFELYQDKVPVTAANFLNLAKDGFYDGVIFHRVIEDFMAQVGDPLTKETGTEGRWGTGGPGYSIPDEFDATLKHDGPGVVSMANSGPNTGGSQFFITHVATPWLDGKHTVFGKVTKGLDVLMQITVGDKITSVSFK